MVAKEIRIIGMVKRHVSLDMQSGLINKIAVTSADQGDDKTVKQILPNQGAIYYNNWAYPCLQ